MSAPSVPRKVSVVVPVYNEEANLPALLPRLLPVLLGLGRPFEVVFADDGSRDRSLEILKKAAAENPGVVKVVELVRNAGQHMAILAGFTATDGEYVLTLDADLQNPPEEIPKLVEAMDGEMWAESEPGQGSHFYFSLPLAGHHETPMIGASVAVRPNGHFNTIRDSH